MATALPSQLAAFLEADTLGLSLAYQLVEDRVGDLDAHFGDIGFAQVAPPLGLLLAGGFAVTAAARAGPHIRRHRLLAQAP